MEILVDNILKLFVKDTHICAVNALQLMKYQMEKHNWTYEQWNEYYQIYRNNLKNIVCENEKQLNIPAVTPYPEFKLVSIIAGACLKHSDSGEGSFNKEARVILMELEQNGYEIVKKQ